MDLTRPRLVGAIESELPEPENSVYFVLPGILNSRVIIRRLDYPRLSRVRRRDALSKSQAITSSRAGPGDLIM